MGHLDGDRRIEFLVMGQVNPAHPATAKRPDDAIVAQMIAFLEWRWQFGVVGGPVVGGPAVGRGVARRPFLRLDQAADGHGRRATVAFDGSKQLLLRAGYVAKPTIREVLIDGHGRGGSLPPAADVLLDQFHHQSRPGTVVCRKDDVGKSWLGRRVGPSAFEVRRGPAKQFHFLRVQDVNRNQNALAHAVSALSIGGTADTSDMIGLLTIVAEASVAFCSAKVPQLSRSERRHLTCGNAMESLHRGAV